MIFYIVIHIVITTMNLSEEEYHVVQEEMHSLKTVDELRSYVKEHSLLWLYPYYVFRQIDECMKNARLFEIYQFVTKIKVNDELKPIRLDLLKDGSIKDPSKVI